MGIQEKVNEALRDSYELREDRVFEGAGTVCPDTYYLFLFALAKRMLPVLSVDLGSWHGASAWCMKKGHPEGRVASYDVGNQLWDGLRASGAEFFIKGSLEAAHDHQDGSVDILFIDTEHDGDLPRAEFEAWLPKMAPGCVVLFDDVELNEKMKEFWAGFNPAGFVKMDARIHSNAGFGILTREAA